MTFKSFALLFVLILLCSLPVMGQHVCASGADCTTTGNNTHAGSEDFGGILHCGSLTAQTCINTAAATGKTAYFAPGTYTGALTIPDKAKIECASRLSIFTVANAANVPVMTVANNASNVTVRNCKVDANGSNQSVRQQGILAGIVTDFTLDGVEVMNAHDEGVWVSSGAAPGDPGSKRVKIINSYIHDNGSKNTYIAGVADLALDNDTFTNWTTSGAGNAPSLTIYCDNATPTNCNSKVTVTGNRFFNGIGTRFAIESAAASPLAVVDGCTIAGNVLDGNNLDGNGISGYFYNCSMDNVFNNGGGGHRSGYEIQGAHVKLDGTINNGSVAIAGMASGTTTDITVSLKSITNSTANGANDASCVMIGGPGPLTKIRVQGIKCFLTNASPQSGIHIGTYGSTAQVNDITVQNSDIYGPGAAGHGIRLHAATGSSNIRVTGNKTRGFADGWLDDGGTLYDEVTVKDNDFIGSVVPVNHTAFSSGTYRADCNLTAAGQSTMGCAATASPRATFSGATPNAANVNAAITGNGGATTVTNLLNGVNGQTVNILCGDTNTTVQAGTNFSMIASQNFVCTTVKDSVTLFFNGTLWQEIGRSGQEVADTSDVLQSSFGALWTRGWALELITLSTVATTTDSVANLLPANSVIRAVDCRVTTTITTATNWQVGDATTAGRFIATNSTLTSGTTAVGLVHIDQVGAAGPRQTSAAKLRITTTGTPGAGAIRCAVFYDTFSAPTS